jgi:peroxiredoxin
VPAVALPSTLGGELDLAEAASERVVVCDHGLVLADAMGLPTFEAGGQRLFKRLTFVAEKGRIVKVFYPVFPPDRIADEVLAWLAER